MVDAKLSWDSTRTIYYVLYIALRYLFHFPLQLKCESVLCTSGLVPMNVDQSIQCLRVSSELLVIVWARSSNFYFSEFHMMNIESAAMSSLQEILKPKSHGRHICKHGHGHGLLCSPSQRGHMHYSTLREPNDNN